MLILDKGNFYCVKICRIVLVFLIGSEVDVVMVGEGSVSFKCCNFFKIFYNYGVI